MSAAQSNHGSRSASGQRALDARLAELVAGLTDCSPEEAVAAVEAVQTVEPADSDAALEVVARADDRHPPHRPARRGRSS